MDETGMWLRDLEEEAVPEEQETAVEAELPVSEEAAPDWLREMEAGLPETEATPTSGEEPRLPDWLREMEEEPPEAESTPDLQPEEESIPEAGQEIIGKVDINTASVEELAALPGIGDLLAQDIIAHRETFGGFSNVDDLGNIAGIGPATIDELREWVEFSQVEVEAQAETGIETEAGEPSLTEWLQGLDTDTPDTEATKAPAEEVPGEDLPFWLADLAEEAEQEPASTAPSEELPDWLRAEAAEESEQPQPVTPSGWRPAEEAEPPQVEQPPARMAAEETPTEPPAQVPEQVPGEPEPEPAAEKKPSVAPEPEPEPEPQPEPEAQPPVPPEREAYREPVTRSRTGMTGMLSSVQDPNLSLAQNELTRGNIPAAMESYGKLIKKGKLLDEVIFDLREALYRYPVEVIILQTLGDAYMRANRLQDALDAYTKAEELLR
jgi:competence ComEA-like helix-hairpin-helix protein